ncbi:MAG: nickel responsive regulator [Chthonomonadaceae bacterium]|nr:nickel responsive regulator [Chthonomonadaceae bacterium]
MHTENNRTEDPDAAIAPTAEEGDCLVRFGISMPAALVRDLDNWRKSLGYASRSEAVRDLVRDALVEAQWQQDADPDREMVGVVTLVYQHSTRQLSDHLIEIQHHDHKTAQTALHIHLSAENCLEVIVLRGRRADVIHMAGHLTSARGVLHGKFVPTSSGEDLT